MADQHDAKETVPPGEYAAKETVPPSEDVGKQTVPSTAPEVRHTDPKEHVMQADYIKPQMRKIHDSAVNFEEYYYYALKTREEEKGLDSPSLNVIALFTRKKQPASTVAEENGEPKQINTNLAKLENRMQVSDEEWTNASRAFRTAGWGACFYLVRVASPRHPFRC